MSWGRGQFTRAPYFKRKLIRILQILAILIFGYLYFSEANPTLRQYYTLKNRKFLLEQRLIALDKENQHLKELIQRLEKDPYYMEYLIRRDLGYVYPDEKVIPIPKLEDPGKDVPPLPEYLLRWLQKKGEGNPPGQNRSPER